MDFKFREIRDEYELKQAEIAEKMNISRGSYANIEAETANIKLKDFLGFVQSPVSFCQFHSK